MTLGYQVFFPFPLVYPSTSGIQTFPPSDLQLYSTRIVSSVKSLQFEDLLWNALAEQEVAHLPGPAESTAG